MPPHSSSYPAAANILALLAVSGLIASLHAVFYEQGRQIYSLSRIGYLKPPDAPRRPGGGFPPPL